MAGEPATDGPIGRSVVRVEDVRILSARSRYVDDFSPPGTLHAAFLRSEYAHARILSVDAGEARRLPGVALILTAADLTETAQIVSSGPPDFFSRPFLPLTVDKARYVGDPLAIVVASSRAIAEDAAGLIQVDYDPLDPVVSIEAASKPGSPPLWEEHGSNILWQRSWDYGASERDLSLRRLRVQFTSPSQTNVPMEGRGILADFDPSTGQMTIHAGTQAPGRLRQVIAESLSLHESRVRVIVPDVGGAFGQKGWHRPEDIAVAEASRRLGTPVKWIEDRTESLISGGKARDEAVDAEIGYDANGVIHELDVALSLNQGAYPLPSSRATLVGQIRTMFPGAYRLRRFSFAATVVSTNTATYVPYRGPWAIETWVRERLIDMVAADLGLDPIEIRRRNLGTADEERTMLTGPPLRDIQLAPALDLLTDVVDVPTLRAEQAAKGSNRALGIGIACYIEPAPGPPEYMHTLIGMEVTRAHKVQIRLERTGEVVVWIGQSPHGQSHQTTFAQVAAQLLGLEPHDVRVVAGDTSEPPFEPYATGGSSAAHMVGGAVHGAARELRRRIVERAADMLEASPHDIELRDGGCAVIGTPNRRITLQQVASASPDGLGVGSPANGFELTYAFANDECGWSQGVHAAVVEIDLETGLVHFLRYVVIEACGQLIHPEVVAGQIRGGVAQGVGSVLYESCAYDDSGNPLATTLMDYLIPTSVEVPPIEIHHLEHFHDPDAPAYRGVGEGGTIGSTAAILNAIADALRSVNGDAVTERYLPPYRILELAGTITPDEP